VPDTNPLVAVYLNRLSDLLFVLARAANEGDEPLWKPGSYTSGDGDDTEG
jgi:cob(I)alamin adenosyltransferase